MAIFTALVKNFPQLGLAKLLTYYGTLIFYIPYCNKYATQSSEHKQCSRIMVEAAS